ncbi:hypothetical protein BC628DRAFT_1152005 [Trametes gibbosa]|nr:hypothetical protein BC628DRAFT_1152005 [Trametes gibbosa]
MWRTVNNCQGEACGGGPFWEMLPDTGTPPRPAKPRKTSVVYAHHLPAGHYCSL